MMASARGGPARRTRHGRGIDRLNGREQAVRKLHARLGHEALAPGERARAESHEPLPASAVEALDRGGLAAALVVLVEVAQHDDRALVQPRVQAVPNPRH